MADAALEADESGCGFLEKPYRRYRFHNGYIKGATEAMEKIAADEIAEQCRLNAMGQERELKLMAEVKSCAEREAKLVAALEETRSSLISEYGIRVYAANFGVIDEAIDEHHAAKGEANG